MTDFGDDIYRTHNENLVETTFLINKAIRLGIDPFIYNYLWNGVKFSTHQLVYDQIFKVIELKLETKIQ